MLAWIAILLYVVVAAGLAAWAARRTRSLAAYAVGTRDLPAPAPVVGLSLAAQLTSVATFVVNPGLVYAFGLSALLGYGVSAGLGIMLGLTILSRRFRTHGARVQALTVPQWIGTRFGAPVLRLTFAVLSLALVTFATLIVVALSLVLAPMLGVSPQAVAVALTTMVVLGVMMGGATGHAWTNAAQATVMVIVACVLVGAGFRFLGAGDLGARLAAIDPNLVRAINPASPFFRNVFEVFVCNFIVGLAIVCQPHVISKALYLREDRDVGRYLATAIACGIVFTMVLMTGFWARLTIGAPVRIDHAIPTWIVATFSPSVQVLIAIGLLCAGLSTLEGVLLALSSIVSADLYPMLARAPSDRAAWRAGRIGLAVTGAVTIVLALWQIDHPTAGTVAIFAQYGVYLLFSASFVPIACGMFMPAARARAVDVAVFVSLVTYVALAIFRVTPWHNNPAFLATSAIAAAWLTLGVTLLKRE